MPNATVFVLISNCLKSKYEKKPTNLTIRSAHKRNFLSDSSSQVGLHFVTMMVRMKQMSMLVVGK